jgi:hypothetical protein
MKKDEKRRKKGGFETTDEHELARMRKSGFSLFWVGAMAP